MMAMTPITILQLMAGRIETLMMMAMMPMVRNRMLK
jgi:hypothetical protein